MNGDPLYNQPLQLQPFCGVKAAQIKITSGQNLYFLPLNFAFVRINQEVGSALDNAIDLPTPSAAYDSQSQVAFIWWEIPSSMDGQAVKLNWLYPRASTSSAYQYAAVPINGVESDFAITRAATDTRRNMFFIVVATPHNGYYIRAVQDGNLLTSISSANAKLTVTQVGQSFTITDNVSVVAGSGTSVSGTSTFTVNAFSGDSNQMGGVTLANNSPQFFGVSGAVSGTETGVPAFIVVQPGTISAIFVEEATAVTTSTSHTFTLRRGTTYANLADTGLAVVLATGELAGNNSSTTLTVAAGDIITFKMTTVGTADVAKGVALGFLFRSSAV